MTFAGLLILAPGFLLMTLGGIPWLAPEMAAARRNLTFNAIRYSNYRWFWLNGATQAMAQGMQFLILGWVVLDITSSSYQLGLVIFAFGLPNLLLAMLAGIIADRANRLKLLISTRLYVSVLIFALAILRITDLLEIWHVYAVVSLLGTVQALNGPARMAIVADLVKRDDMMNAVALHTMVNQTGQIIGRRCGRRWHPGSPSRCSR